MRARRIPQHEESFESSEVDAAGKRHILLRKAIEIPGETDEMRYTEIRPSSGDESYFYRSKHPKEQIVLHFTMGYVKGDVAALTRSNYHVSVPFLIARSGVIYNLFPSVYWSYHLGEGAVGGNGTRSKGSLGVEISNIGPLTSSGSDLLTIYSKPRQKQVYCARGETGYYVEAAYRGWEYFATFTNAQYESLIVLLRYLTRRYGIRCKFLPASKRYTTSEETAHFNGIVSHVNFRAKRKTDIGPAFDWDRVIEGVRG